MQYLDAISKTRIISVRFQGKLFSITKFKLKLKKVEKTTRPFKYELNQIPSDYRVGVRNRFKRLDLIECLMNYGQRFVTLYRKQGSKPSPWKEM